MSSEMTKRLAQAQAIRELGIGSDVSAKSFDAATQRAKNDIGNTDFVGVANIQKETTTAKSVWDMQKKKEDAFQRVQVKPTKEKDPPLDAKRRLDLAKKAYDDYINSEEYRQKQVESVRAQQQAMDQDETQVFSSTSDMMPPAPKQDQKEYMLRLAKEAAEQEYNEAEDKKRFEADMEVINGLSEEDRKRLEIYSASKYNDRELPEEYLVDSLLEDFGRERLDELERTFSRYKNAKRAEEVDAKAREFVSKRGGRGTLANILSIPVQAYSGIIGTGGQLAEMMIGTGGYKTQDPNAYGTIGQTLKGAIRGQTSENITEDLGDGFLGKAASTGYQAVMSAADAVARAYMGGNAFMGATLAATGSFSQTMADASRQGATPAQAALLATVTAGIEAATEKIPLDDLIKVAKGEGASTVLKNLLRQAGIEASTEELSLFGTMLAEAAILQEKSQYNQTLYTELLAGKPEAEARQAAAMEIWNEVVNTALVSGLSGGLSSLGGSYANARGLFAEAQKQTNPEQKTFVDNLSEMLAQKNAQKQPETEQNIPEADTKQATRASEQATMQASAPTTQQVQQTTTQQSEQQNLADIFTEMFTQMRKEKDKQTATIPGSEAKETQVSAQMPNRMENVAAVDDGSRSKDLLAEMARKVAYSEKGATNAMAKEILENPEALKKLQEQAGVKIAGTKAEQRKAVKDALNVLAPKQKQKDAYDTIMDAIIGSGKSTEKVSKGEGAEVEAKQTGKQQESFDPSGTVGSAKSGFRHEVRESGLYGNTYRNANTETTREIGKEAQKVDPAIGRYDLITEEESLNEARLRSQTPQDRYVEHRYLLKKDGWSGADNDTAMRLLAAYQKEGKGDRFRELVRKQREMATQGGQLSQSFAKYSREDATVAVKDAVDDLEKMGMKDVPRKFWKSAENTRAAKVGDPDDYSDTSASRMTATEQENTISSKRKLDKDSFDAWKTSITNSMLEIANDIESTPQDDVESMRNIVRQLAQFRRTTAWFGMGDNLTKNADRILKKMDFDTAKTIAKAQLAMIPDDFRKRSAGETAKTIRVHNMLSALTTVHRNTVGNTTMGILDAFSDSTTARAMDVAMSKFTGIRTVGNDLKYGKTYFNAARDAADMAALCVELNIPMDSESIYSPGNTRTHSTQGGPLMRFLSAYEKYMKYALEVSDKFFEGGSSAAVKQSIRNLGAKTGLSEDQIAGLSERAGERRTFKENRDLARGAQKIKEGANTMLGFGDVGAGDILMPLAQVPTNVVQTGIDYSGTGIVLGVKEMVNLVNAARNGETVIKNSRTGEEIPLEIAQRKAVSDFGRGLTGIGLVALSAVASAMGAIKVHNSKDWEQKGLEQAQNLDGAQMNLSAIGRGMSGENAAEDPTQWKPGDVVFGMDFLQPFNSSMHIGYLLSQEPDFISMVKNYPKHALAGIFESVMDMPVMALLSDLQELVQSLGETDEEGNPATMDTLGQMAGTIATSAVPSFVRQTAQTIDPYYRETYDPNPWKQAGNKVAAAIPFVSRTLPEKYDGLGNVQKRYDDTTAGGKFLGALNNMFFPDRIEQVKGNDITAYLSRLSAETGDTSVYPEEQAPYKFALRGEEIELTGEQRATYQKTYGEKNATLYGGLITYPGFSELPEDMQIDAFEKAKNYATQFAKASVADYRDVPQETTEALIKKIVNDSVNASFTNAFSDLTESWDLEYDPADAITSLDQAYETYQGLPEKQRNDFLEFTSGRVKYYLDARDAGIDTEKFTTLYGEYRDIDASEGFNSTEKANEWAVILEESVDDGYITEAQKDVLKKNLVFRYSFVAETQKFDIMIDAGMKPFIADYVIDIVSNVKGTGSWDAEAKKYKVRDIDERQAIAESNLPDREKDIAIKAYMPDYDPNAASQDRTEVKYEYAREVMGLSPEEYAETFRAYQDARYKADKIAEIQKLGYSRSVAESLYYLYYGNQKKIPSVAWYEEKHGLQ